MWGGVAVVKLAALLNWPFGVSCIGLNLRCDDRYGCEKLREYEASRIPDGDGGDERK